MVRCPSCRSIFPACDDRQPSEDSPPSARSSSDRTKPRRKVARKTGSDTTKVLILVAVGAFVLFGCLASAGLGVYLYSGGSIVGPSSREQLVGQWETDPDFTKREAAKNPLGAGFHVDLGLTFNADQTYHQRHILNLHGRWNIESGIGNTARVRMVARIGEFDSDPIYAVATFLDRDHLDWDQNGVVLRYRRVGTTSPSPTAPLTPSVTPRESGPDGVGGFGRDRPGTNPPGPKSPFGRGPSGSRPNPWQKGP